MKNHDSKVVKEKAKSQVIVSNKVYKLDALEKIKQKYLLEMKSKNRQEAGFQL